MKMIKQNSTSFRQIRDNVIEYLSGLDNWEEIKDNLPASNLTLITDIVAGFGSFLIYKNNQLANETYLSTAKNKFSVWEIARTFGYEIKRYTAPSIKLKYNGIPTLLIHSGEILGKYLQYDLIYFGADKYLEKLDTIDVKIGEVNRELLDVIYDGDSLKYTVSPSVLESIDNDCISLYVDDVILNISKKIEDYVVQGKVVDYSYTPFSTEIIISDTKFSYGTPIDILSKLEVLYIETDGKIDSLDTRKATSLLTDFVALSVNHLGSNGQDIDQIRNLAPLFYSTQRRMVTKSDYKYVAETHQYIKSASAIRDDGRNKTITLSLQPSEANVFLNFDINNESYKFFLTSGDSLNLHEQLFTKLSVSKEIQMIGFDEEGVYVESADPKYPPYIAITTSALTQSITDVGLKPRCCTVLLYYVKYNVIDDPILLTSYEQKQLSDFLLEYKMVTSRIVLVPADRISLNMDLLIKLTNNQYQQIVEKDIRNIVKKYELTINTAFNYKTILSEISRISVITNDGETVFPVISVVVDELLTPSNALIVAASETKYVKLTPLNIKLG